MSEPEMSTVDQALDGELTATTDAKAKDANTDETPAAPTDASPDEEEKDAKPVPDDAPGDKGANEDVAGPRDASPDLEPRGEEDKEGRSKRVAELRAEIKRLRNERANDALAREVERRKLEQLQQEVLMARQASRAHAELRARAAELERRLAEAPAPPGKSEVVAVSAVAVSAAGDAVSRVDVRALLRDVEPTSEEELQRRYQGAGRAPDARLYWLRELSDVDAGELKAALGLNWVLPTPLIAGAPPALLPGLLDAHRGEPRWRLGLRVKMSFALLALEFCNLVAVAQPPEEWAERAWEQFVAQPHHLYNARLEEWARRRGLPAAAWDGPLSERALRAALEVARSLHLPHTALAPPAAAPPRPAALSASAAALVQQMGGVRAFLRLWCGAPDPKPPKKRDEEPAAKKKRGDEDGRPCPGWCTPELLGALQLPAR